MPRDPLAATRVPQDYIDRLDALADKMISDEKIVALVGKPTRAAVLRLAIKRGLESLEAEYPARKPAKGR